MHAGDIGIEIRYILQRRDPSTDETSALDISVAGTYGEPSVRTFVFEGPTGRFTRTPSILSATGGVLSWTTTLATDFSTPGTYTLQPQLTFATATLTWDAVEFEVEETL